MLSGLTAWRSRTVGSASIYLVATATASLLVAVGQALLANLISVESFGVFSFSVSFLAFAALLFEFGLFLPIARLTARAEGPEKSELIGATLLLFVPVAAAFGATVFAASFFVDSVFAVDGGSALRAVAPLAGVYPFLVIALLLAQGSGRLDVYSLTTPLGPLLFALIIAAALAAGVSVGVPMLLLLRAGAYLIGLTLLVIWLRPVFRRARSHLATIRTHAREYGFQLYLGNVLAHGSYQLDVLLLAALSDARTVALYAVATSLSNAIALPGQGIAATIFPRLARGEPVRAEWRAAPWVAGGVGIVVAWLVAEPFFRTVFSPEYAKASTFIVPLGIAAALRGITGIYNSYLFARGKGHALRNAAAVFTAMNLSLNLLLIPPFGGLGAAWASAAALLANLLVHVVYYRRERRAAHESAGAPPPRDAESATDQSASVAYTAPEA